MSIFGVTPFGFRRKRLPEIKAEIEAALRAAFGPDIDLRSESTFGQIVGITSFALAVLWEESEDAYFAFDPDKAEAVSLDAVAALTGITRLPARATQVQGMLIGEQSTVVPAGSQASNGLTGDIYVLQSAAEITAANALRVKIEVNDVQPATAYTVTIDGTPYEHTSGGTPTAGSILSGLRTLINAGTQATATVDMDSLSITTADSQTARIFSVSANLAISEVGSPGQFQAQSMGNLLLPAGALSEIETPVFGWEAVANLLPGTPGRSIESDPALRLRRRQSIDFTARATTDAIFSRVAALEGVVDVLVYDNKTDETDAFGVPRQHVWVIVQGGDDVEIAQAIFSVMPGGIGYFGAEEVRITSAVTGQDHDIRFERPTPVEVWIDMTVKATNGFGEADADEIKARIVQYVRENVGISKTLFYSRLFTPINSVPNHEVLELFIGTAPAPAGTSSISVSINEIISVDESRINVVIDDD